MTQLLNQHFSPGVAHSWEKTAAGFIRCHARVLKEGIMNYGREELSDIPPSFQGDVVRVLVTKESMGTGEALRSLETAQATAWDHQWITPENAATASVGSTVGTPRIEGPYLECDMVITEPNAIADIEAGKLPEISSAYEAGVIFEPGEFDGQHFDARQTGLLFNHNAIIPQGHGRAGVDVRILNMTSRWQNALIDKLESFAGQALKPGRFTIKGYPVDISDSDGSFIEMNAVDRDAASGLINELKKSGFKVRRSGDKGIVLNTKEEPKMALVKIKLLNGRYINVEEEVAKEVEGDQAAVAEKEAGSGKKLEELMSQVAELNAQIAELTAQAEEGKGELSVYKEKIDELLSMESQEAVAEGMIAERTEADEIIENVTADMPEDKKEEVKNSLVKDGRRLYGEPLKRAVLAVTGQKCENMSPAEVNGAFRAVHVMIKNGHTKKTVSGATFMNNLHQGDPKAARSQIENAKKRMWGKKD
jgi:hypothetical protein